jgi:hypothetical protein
VNFEIRSIAGNLLFATEATSLSKALEAAVYARADLTGADLTGAVLTGAVLRRADLTDAVLTDADLTGAVLRRAVLTDADLTGAVLTGADLTDADLTGAVLRRADLTDAVLRRADLTDADLTGAVLTDAVGLADWLATIRDDIFAVLDAAPNEVAGLADALRQGRVNGSVYSGECACLLGTLANVRGCAVDGLGIPADSSRPAEQWFLRISVGQTPNSSIECALAFAWVCEWQAAHAGSTLQIGGAR